MRWTKLKSPPLLERPEEGPLQVLAIDPSRIFLYRSIRISKKDLTVFAGNVAIQEGEMHSENSIPIFVKSFSEHVISYYEYLLALPDHPSLLNPFFTVLVNGRPSVAFHHAQNGNLGNYLQKHAYSFPQKLQMSIRIGRAILALHRSGIVHGNLKTENVLFDLYDNVRLADPTAPAFSRSSVCSIRRVISTPADDARAFGYLMGGIFSEKPTRADKRHVKGIPIISLDSPVAPIIQSLMAADLSIRKTLTVALEELEIELYRSAAPQFALATPAPDMSVEASTQDTSIAEVSIAQTPSALPTHAPMPATPQAPAMSSITALVDKNRKSLSLMVENNNRMTTTITNLRKLHRKTLAELREKVAQFESSDTTRSLSIQEIRQDLESVLQASGLLQEQVESTHDEIKLIQQTMGGLSRKVESGSSSVVFEAGLAAAPRPPSPLPASVPRMRIPEKNPKDAVTPLPANPGPVMRSQSANYVANFAAFDAADTLLFVRRGVSLTIFNAIGFCLSEPIELDSLDFTVSEGAVAAVSLRGVLGVLDDAAGCLWLHNFFSGVTAKVLLANVDAKHTPGEGGPAGLIAFSGEYLVFGRVGSRHFFRANIAELFAQPSSPSFRDTKVPVISESASTADRCPFVGYLVYRSEARYVRFDVDSMKVRAMRVKGPPGSIVCTTGIEVPGTTFVCTWTDEGGTQSVGFVTATTSELERVCAVPRRIEHVIPSSLSPGNFLKAGFIDEARTLHFYGRHRPFTVPIRPAVRTLVRICEDMFVAFDQMRGRWVASRIWVD
eukprot:gnl/Chilomastix_cuspidata/2563.p1 GENE.gnl/Chilomastix_cuspidata/2563~~gnl/Chilomastix_cuspidata/2563.p1  ORF type:complete len:783 (+),score=224.01 gnl/Chilomastix_cuspidata/2563:121-2469(+)